MAETEKSRKSPPRSKIYNLLEWAWPWLTCSMEEKLLVKFSGNSPSRRLGKVIHRKGSNSTSPGAEPLGRCWGRL